MATQSYATHRHNPKPTGIGFLFVVLALVAFSLRWFEIGGRAMFAAGLLSLSASIVVLLSISRTYTTKLQDRIIKLEMRLRCAQLLSGAQQATLNRLSNPQIVALRFASDESFPVCSSAPSGSNSQPIKSSKPSSTGCPTWIAPEIRPVEQPASTGASDSGPIAGSVGRAA